MKTVVLKPGKEQSVKRLHPWVFSGAIQKIVPHNQVVNGDLVTITDHKGNFLAKGFYNDGSIAVRIITWTDEEIHQHFWNCKIQNAYSLRNQLGLTDHKETNIYRLFYGEADGIPGLIIDIYNQTAVIQCHHIGVYRFVEHIASAVKTIYGNKIKAIYDKSNETIHCEDIVNQYLYKAVSKPVFTAQEHGIKYIINWEDGQKTGFFIDQRDNRKLLAHYSQNKSVLNTFCYTGGFSLAALKAGAKMVHSVDSSQKAIELTNKNVELNKLSDKHKAFTSDTLHFLKTEELSKYDIVILDPPAYAKNIKKRHNAIQGYKRLNATAMKKMKKGSLLFTFSCSQAIDKNLFKSTITAAALEAKRKIKILHFLSQPADHPVSLFHPEGEYLKGLVLYVW